MADTVAVVYDGPAQVFNGKPRGAEHKLTMEQIVHLQRPSNGGHQFTAKGNVKLPEAPRAGAPVEEDAKP